MKLVEFSFISYSYPYKPSNSFVISPYQRYFHFFTILKLNILLKYFCSLQFLRYHFCCYYCYGSQFRIARDNLKFLHELYFTQPFHLFCLHDQLKIFSIAHQKGCIIVHLRNASSKALEISTLWLSIKLL